MKDSNLKPTPLDNDRFVEIIDIVRRRKTDPEAAKVLENDPDVGPTWKRLLAACDSVVQRMNARMARFSSTDFRRHAFGQSLTNRRSYVRAFAPEHEGLLTPELALVLGELSRVSRMEPEELDSERIASVELSEGIREGFGEEKRLEALYPLAHMVSDVFLRHERPKIEAGTGGLPLDIIMRGLRDLDLLQDRLGPVSRKKTPITHVNVTPRLVATLGKELATQRFMDIKDLPPAYQVCYDEHWHTNPKTKSATGAYVDELREWTLREGSPELLIVLAASSDGRNRAVAGRCARTPEPVYDKMIYDNALAVLFEVVQNERFNDARAYSMMKSNGAHQVVAVMIHGKVDISIRALACEKAIKHPGVDPYWVYAFLASNVNRADEVPHAYWIDFVKETKVRLDAIRVHGNEKQISMYESRLKRFSSAFIEEVLAPYAEAAQRIDTSTTSDPVLRRSPYAQRELEKARAFVRAHEFVRDPDLLDLVLETETGKEELVQLLTYCHEANIPISQKLMVTVLQHPDREVRETGMGMIPNVREEEVQAAAVELRQRVQADYDAVRDKVLTDVIPDFEDITGSLRKRSANHHYFEAADDIELDELVRIFQRCYEDNPTTIPDQFYQASIMKRFTQRQRTYDEDRTPIRPDPVAAGKRVSQGDLFGGGEVPDGQSTTVEQTKPTPRRTARR